MHFPWFCEIGGDQQAKAQTIEYLHYNEATVTSTHRFYSPVSPEHFEAIFTSDLGVLRTSRDHDKCVQCSFQ